MTPGISELPAADATRLRLPLVRRLTPAAGRLLRGGGHDGFAIALLSALGLAVGAIGSQLSLINPFLFFRLARVESWLHAGGFVPYPLNVSIFDPQRPLYEMLLAGIRLATDLSALQIATLPVGAVALPVACYIVSQRLLNDRMVAFLLAVALLVNHAFAEVHLGTFVYAWADFMLFAFVGVLWAVASEGKSPIRIAALVCIFFMTEWIYPTTATWMIFIIGALALTSWLRGLRVRSRTTVGLAAITLAFTAYFLYFDRVFSNSFVAALGRAGVGSQLSRTIDELIAQVTLGFAGAAAVTEPYHIVRTSSPVATVVIVSQYGLLAVAIAVAIAMMVRGIIRHKPIIWSERFTVLVALMVGAAGHTAAYSLAGHYSPRAFGLLGGVIGALALVAIGVRPKAIRIWALCLAAASAVGLGAFFATVPSAPSSAATSAAASWLVAQEREPVVTADLGLYGRMLLTAAAQGRTIQLAALDSCGFAHLVEASPGCGPDSVGRYVVIDLRNLDEPMQADGWRTFGPPGAYWAQIFRNPAHAIAYEQDGILILKRAPDEP